MADSDEAQHRIDEFRNKVNLNVGGAKFTTSKSTLLAERGTLFDAQIRSGAWVPDEDGTFFVDRNPRFFPALLDYLRMRSCGKEGTLLVGAIDPGEQTLLDADIEYYKIGSLQRTVVSSDGCAWKLETKNMGKMLTMSEDCLSIIKTGPSGNADSSVKGTLAFYEGTHRWRAIVDPTESFWIFFGYSPAR